MTDETGKPEESSQKEPRPSTGKDSRSCPGTAIPSSTEDRIREFTEYLLDIGIRI